MTLTERWLQESSQMAPKKKKTVAKSFSEILKFNPYHDSRGRFASANSYASFTYAPGKSKAHDLAIAREKERQSRAAATPKVEAKIERNSQTTIDRVVAWHEKNFKSRLTEEGREFLDDYTGRMTDDGFVGGSQPINGALRSGKPLPKNQQSGYENMIQAMDKNPTTRDMQVFRSVSSDAFGLEKYKKYDTKDFEHLLGQKITDKGFMSTSLDFDFADEFGGGYTPITMSIKVPKGTPCGCSNLLDSAEIILKPGTSVKVVGVGGSRKNQEGGIIIMAEVLGGGA